MGLSDPGGDHLGGRPVSRTNDQASSGRTGTLSDDPARAALARFLAFVSEEEAAAERHATRALDLAGSIDRLFALPPERIAAHGLPGPVALLIGAAAEVRRVASKLQPGTVRLQDRAAIRRAVISALGRADQEVMLLLAFDGSDCLSGTTEVHRGARDRLALCLRTVVQRALDLSARTLIVAHNHPSGQARPSPSDIAATRELVAVLHPLGIRLADHFVVARDQAYSFADAGLL